MFELDYNDGAYAGYKAYYKASGQSFTHEEVDETVVGAPWESGRMTYCGLVLQW